MLSTITIIILAVALVYTYVKLNETRDVLEGKIEFYRMKLSDKDREIYTLREKLSYLTPAENKKLEARIAKGKVVKTKTKKTK